MAKWISPTAAMNLIFDDPARIGADESYGFGVQWANVDGERSLTADLARAKLQPRKPTSVEITVAGSDWAVTAHDYRLIMAPGVADVRGPRELFETYDGALPKGQNLLAVIQTLRFDPDQPRHAMMQAAHLYVSMCLQPKRLTTMIVQHMPCDLRSARAPHVHLLTLARTHRLSGFGEVHALFEEAPAEMHRAFADDWQRFKTALGKIGA